MILLILKNILRIPEGNYNAENLTKIINDNLQSINLIVAAVTVCILHLTKVVIYFEYEMKQKTDELHNG